MGTNKIVANIRRCEYFDGSRDAQWLWSRDPDTDALMLLLSVDEHMVEWSRTRGVGALAHIVGRWAGDPVIVSNEGEVEDLCPEMYDITPLIDVALYELELYRAYLNNENYDYAIIFGMRNAVDCAMDLPMIPGFGRDVRCAEWIRLRDGSLLCGAIVYHSEPPYALSDDVAQQLAAFFPN